MRWSSCVPRWTAAAVATWAVSACAGSTHPDLDNASLAATKPAPARVTALADDYFFAWIRTFPVSALYSGVPEAPNDLLEDNSIPVARAWERREDRWLAALRHIPAEQLAGTPEEVTYGVLLETLQAARQARVCRGELWRLDQQGGWQIYLPLVSQLQPLGTAPRRAAALARWRAMPRLIDTEIDNLREGLRTGYTQPRGNAEAVLGELDDLLKSPAGRSPFAGLAARDSTPGFRDSVVAIVAGAILPAVRRYRGFLADEYIPRTRRITALSAIPNGKDCYRALVRTYTTEDLDPKAVHQLGLRQIATLEAGMRPIAERSFGTASLPALFERLRTDRAFTFQSREEIIRTANAAVARATAAMPKWFGRLPKADVIVDPCLHYEEKSGCPNSYVSGSTDGSRPGRWRINAGNVPPQPRSPLEGTAFHETIPGHHLQIALAQERPGAHPITRYFGFSAFAEGWALYAERMALDMGIYSSDLARFGELGEQSLRAARLVVDPGLHALGWSRQQALDYMLAHVPNSRATLESEVDRYIATPGQATAYMVGRLEIERLRREARSRLGAAFDIREFHDRVLEIGSVPLAELRAHIEAWLDGRTSRSQTN